MKLLASFLKSISDLTCNRIRCVQKLHSRDMFIKNAGPNTKEINEPGLKIKVRSIG